MTMEPKTVSQVLEKLLKEGYTESFKAQGKRLRALVSEVDVDPDHLVIDKFYRFEGETDLNDEAIIFALACPTNKIKGTLLVAFGSQMDPFDVEIVLKLKKKYEQNRK